MTKAENLSTLLSTYFKDRRLALGLRPGEVARRMGYRSIVGASNQIGRFEETGSIHAELFVKLALALNIEQATVERLDGEVRLECGEGNEQKGCVGDQSSSLRPLRGRRR